MNEQDEQRAREVAKVFISRCPDGLTGEIAGSEEWASRTLTELLATAFAAVREDAYAHVAEQCGKVEFLMGNDMWKERKALNDLAAWCGQQVAAIRGGR